MKRTHLIGGAAVLGCLALPAAALGTSSTVTADCSVIRTTYSTFGPPPQADARVVYSIDGGALITVIQHPSGPFSTFTIPLNLVGTHTVGVEVAGRPGINAFSSFPVTQFVCGSPIVPPALTPPGPPPPADVPVAPVTCAELRAAYPKAGKARIISWGCAVPKVTKPKPPKRVTRRPVCGQDFYLYRRPVAGTWTCKRIVPRPNIPPVTG